MQRSRIVIVGGGVAGLAAANALADHGLMSSVVEAGAIGREKVTGEFFSAESLPLLGRWGIQYQVIDRAIFHALGQVYDMSFGSNVAGSVSVVSCERQLAARARSMGVTIHEDMRVASIVAQGAQGYELVLAHGESLSADILLIAAGRFPRIEAAQVSPRSQATSLANREPLFIGLKMHYTSDRPVYQAAPQLEFYMHNGAYWGVTALETAHTNITCLVPCKYAQQYANHQQLMDSLCAYFPALYTRVMQATPVYDAWLTVPVFGFGEKRQAQFNNVFYLGDARATIHPISGNGLSMAIGSAQLAAQYIAEYERHPALFERESLVHQFSTRWDQLYRSRLRWARMLHEVAIRPRLMATGLWSVRYAPWLGSLFYSKTRS